MEIKKNINIRMLRSHLASYCASLLAIHICDTVLIHMFGNATNPIGSCSKAAHDGHSFKPCHIYLESVVFRGIYLPLFATCSLSVVVLGTNSELLSTLFVVFIHKNPPTRLH